MKPIKQFIILVLGLILYQTAFAQGDSKSKLTFEPLYGVETSLVRYPDPARYVTRATYGARVLYGSTLLSGEAEYTTAKSRNDYPGINQKVEDSVDRASLGLRSTIALASFLGIYLRAGGRASQGKTVITTSGVADTKDNPLRVDPYGGVGIQLALGPAFAINAGATLIRNFDNKYDAQYTLGLSGRFGNQ
jgi:hypothetical protein